MGECVVERLGRVEWGRFGVAVVVVFGSAARCGSARDVDVLVVPWGRLGLEAEAEIMRVVEESVGLPVDLVVVEPWDPDCGVLQVALGEGRLVYVDGGRGAGLFSRLVMACYDYLLAKRRVGYLEAMVERVLEGAAGETS